MEQVLAYKVYEILLELEVAEVVADYHICYVDDESLAAKVVEEFDFEEFSDIVGVPFSTAYQDSLCTSSDTVLTTGEQVKEVMDKILSDDGTVEVDANPPVKFDPNSN